VKTHGDTVSCVQTADAVRSHNPDIVLVREGRDLLLELASLLADLREACPEEHRVLDLFLGACFQSFERPSLGHGEQRHVYGSGHIE
jgi:hypothetical protein